MNNFFLPNNLNTPVVPGPNSRVIVDSLNPLTATGAVSILDLRVAGEAGGSTVTFGGTLDVRENITIEQGGTLVLNRPTTINQNLIVLEGGLLTHDINAADDVNKLNLTVHGDVWVDYLGTIDVYAKGYRYRTGIGTGDGQRHGSYGGHGAIANGESGPCYGSIIAPTNRGSGGHTDYGGGAIIINSYGSFHNEGTISANGGNSGYAGSGGTVFITAASISGTGSITADGGYGTSAGAGGGRISLVVTEKDADFSNWTGLISAYAKGVGAGTVYLERGIDKPAQGRVVIDNNGFNAQRWTDLPPTLEYTPGEIDHAILYIHNDSLVRINESMTLWDLWLWDENSVLDLNFNTLYVNSLPHTLEPGSVINLGEIKWLAGTLLQFW
ncbi:MAG: hypothetical protein GX811_10220 [Lentisphaerae bacterium]|nr:hypothetical protein [Lentisphaerota bacterium]